MEIEKKIMIVCRKCGNSVKIKVTIEVSPYNRQKHRDIYNVDISDAEGEKCKKCGRRIAVFRIPTKPGF